MKAWTILGLVLIAGGAGGAWWLMQGGGAGLGPATPKADVSLVNFDWVLAEGELLQGTEELEVPLGINVALEVDNDLDDVLVIDGYDVEFELEESSVVPIDFNAYQKGRFPIRLKSSDHKLGTLIVVSPP